MAAAGLSVACPTEVLAEHSKRAAVALVGRPKNPRALRSSVRDALRKSGTGLLPLAAERATLAARSGYPAPRLVAAAHKDIQQAEEELAALRVDRAHKHLLAAKRRLAPHLGFPEVTELDRRRLMATVVVAHARRDFEWENRIIAQLAGRHGIAPPSHWGPEQLATLESVPLPPAATVQINVAWSDEPPRRLRIYLDGRLRCESLPCVTQVLSGSRRLVVDAEGYVRHSQMLELARSGPVQVDLTPDLAPRLRALARLEELPQALVADIERWARSMKLAHIVLVQSDDERLRLRRLDVGRGIGGIVELSPDRGRAELHGAASRLDAVAPGFDPEPWAWASGVSGVALMSAGLALRLVAAARQDDTLSRAGALTQAEAFSRRDQAETEELVGGILLGLGGALLVTSAVFGVEAIEW